MTKTAVGGDSLDPVGALHSQLEQLATLRDAFDNPIPVWAVWAHYQRVDVSRWPGEPKEYIPGSLLVRPVRGSKYREAGNRVHVRKLTANDPEPPIGTVVRICDGTHWVRTPQPWGGTYWLPVNDMAGGDPESWTKIAGNYGPVTVVPR